MEPLFKRHRTAGKILQFDGTERRRAQLLAILREGLSTRRSYVCELNLLLTAAPVDLQRVSKAIRSDVAMTAQFLRTCNVALRGYSRRPLGIEESVVLMGAERLQTWLLACSIMELASRHLSAVNTRRFWQHGFMTGMLSERIAYWVGYPERERAYLGGLLHDVGMLPLLALAASEQSRNRNSSLTSWRGSLESEKRYCGLTHCEVGRQIGESWHCNSALIDVFEHHHHPELSTRDSHLVGIVAAADGCSETWIWGRAAEGSGHHSGDSTPDDEFLARCFPRLDIQERAELADMLESECLHLLPAIEFANPAFTAAGIA